MIRGGPISIFRITIRKPRSKKLEFIINQPRVSTAEKIVVSLREQIQSRDQRESGGEPAREG